MNLLVILLCHCVHIFLICYGGTAGEMRNMMENRLEDNEIKLKRVQGMKESELMDSFKNFGKLGVNYHIGTYADDEQGVGREKGPPFFPYIVCQKYDHSECLKSRKTREECEQTVNCIIKDQMPSTKRLACMAVYLYNTTENGTSMDQGSLQPHLKDCWSQEEDQLRECISERKCVADTRRTGQVDRASKFCCCRTHECNREMVVDGTTNAVPERTLLSPLSDHADEWFVANLISILFVFILFGCVCFAFLLFLRTLRNKFPNRNGNSKAFLSSGKDERNGQKAALLPEKEEGFGEREIVFEDGQKAHSKDIELFEKVSNGRFGQVYRAQLADHPLAVKIFVQTGMDSWINEMDLYSLGAIRANENISKFYGGFQCENNSCWLLTRFYGNNSLFDYLKGNTVSLGESIRMVTSMLEGLAFLHEEVTHGQGQKPTIVHRDLKSKNILVKDDLSTCITDFGLALKCETRGVSADQSHGQVGTTRYMSPEVLEGATEFSSFAFQQIDVYAAALVIWEVFSRTTFETGENEDISDFLLPYELEVGQNPSISQIRELVVVQRHRPKTRQSLHQNQFSAPIVRTMREMWEHEPDGRITSSCARDRLMRIQQQQNS